MTSPIGIQWFSLREIEEYRKFVFPVDLADPYHAPYFSAENSEGIWMVDEAFDFFEKESAGFRATMINDLDGWSWEKNIPLDWLKRYREFILPSSLRSHPFFTVDNARKWVQQVPCKLFIEAYKRGEFGTPPPPLLAPRTAERRSHLPSTQMNDILPQPQPQAGGSMAQPRAVVTPLRADPESYVLIQNQNGKRPQTYTPSRSDAADPDVPRDHRQHSHRKKRRDEGDGIGRAPSRRDVVSPVQVNDISALRVPDTESPPRRFGPPMIGSKNVKEHTFNPESACVPCWVVAYSSTCRLKKVP